MRASVMSIAVRKRIMDRTRAWLIAFRPAFQKGLPKVDDTDGELLELLRRADEQRCIDRRRTDSEARTVTPRR